MVPSSWIPLGPSRRQAEHLRPELGMLCVAEPLSAGQAWGWWSSRASMIRMGVWVCRPTGFQPAARQAPAMSCDERAATLCGCARSGPHLGAAG